MKDINEQDILGKTALMRAVWNGELEKVKELLNDDNIDVNLQDKDGWTALMSASYCGHTETVKELLNHKGIDINLQDNWGKTVSDIAKEPYNGVIKILEDFINKSEAKK